MWQIRKVSTSSTIYMSDGSPVTGTTRGPRGASFRLYIEGCGMLDITDVGHESGGPRHWKLEINGLPYWYNRLGSLEITISKDGKFQARGDGNDICGHVLPLPTIWQGDLKLLESMKKLGLVPYTQLEPGERPYEDVKDVAKQYFQFSPAWFDLGLSIYDWTSADFFRMTMWNVYRYTSIWEQPLSDDDIITSIWTTNWPPYTAKDAPFMASMMMTPANSRDEVACQYKDVNQKMKTFLGALKRITTGAMYALPRTSTISIPKVFSGQVDISGQETDAWAVYFKEYPGNKGPVGSHMGMSLREASEGFMKPGNMVTTKTFVSFTDSIEDAQKYSNGIIIEATPKKDAAVWTTASYVTPLSNGPTKTEYLFPPGSEWVIKEWSEKSLGTKSYVFISVEETGYKDSS